MNIAMVGLRGIGPQVSGGVERHVEELAVRLVRLGHKVTVFGRSGYVPDGETEYHGVSLVSRPAISSKHLEAITNTMACLPSLCRTHDVVHFHATGPTLLAFVPRLFGKGKVVSTVHGLDYMRAKWGRFARTVLYAGAWSAGHFPNETIVVSKKLRRYYHNRFRRAATYIPNGVNTPARRGLNRLHDKFGLTEDEYILSMGRLTPEKGVHYLIPAFQGLETSHKLVIAGDQLHGDDYLRRLRELAGDDKRIVFTGALYGEEKDEAFSNAAAFVLPSELEGMPIVMLEAMSYGCPVLSTDIEECAEVWETAKEETGIQLCSTFRSMDVADLQQNLRALLVSTERKAMGERAMEYILSRYGWDGIVKDTLDVYRRALSLDGDLQEKGEP